ncbi:ATP-binding protein [Brotaphodocola sp.]|uniref:ATP-binding protein n=1 Tax=Brotaphodocola sp. TaxID=3073577 RepID=UPI003D7DC8E7
MEQVYQDIPRFYTALSEWGVCTVYCLLLKKRKEGRAFLIYELVWLILQGAVLVLTERLPMLFWLPCMIFAVGMMIFFLYTICKISWKMAVYCGVKAFLLAEFTASLEWQLDCYVRGIGVTEPIIQIFLLCAIYGAVFLIAWKLEKKVIQGQFPLEISRQELCSAVLIVMASFAFSNLSFLYQDTPFSSRFVADIFNIRTLVDLGGVAILYAYQSRIYELNAEREIASINTMLKSQYDHYRHYQESIDLINMKYHDLKHQIAGLRAEQDSEKRTQWLNAMEEELKWNQADIQTGNHVLDTVLTGKMMYCQAHNMNLTCVADGELLNFLHVTDICTIFGNALDNAIESLMMVEDPQKRLIHVQITAKKSFLFIQVENYCDRELKLVDGYPETTKADKENHGIGLKSIRHSVEKYGGNVSFAVNKNWFELRILIPRPTEE